VIRNLMRGANDLPLARDASSRFLPWLIAFMVWLAAIALAAAMMLSTAGGKWRSGLSGTLTVQIVPLGGEGPEALAARVESALGLLRDAPGVASAHALPDAEILKLVEPWLGKAALGAELGLPLPRLIDVRLAEGTAMDTRALGARLAGAVPGASLDDHGLWLDRLLALAGAVEAIAYAVLAMIGLAAVATVVFTTRTGLAIHQEEIELLHLIGAQDSYVARQFQRHALRLGLKGGVAGLVMAIATLLLLATMAARIGTGLLPPLALSGPQWASLAGLALAAALISTLTARVTVLRALARMP
jgi:cell division transport system permease protein